MKLSITWFLLLLLFFLLGFESDCLGSWGWEEDEGSALLALSRDALFCEDCGCENLDCCEGGCSPKNGNCEGYVCFELDEMFLLDSVSLNDSTSLIWLFEESFRGGEVKSISISLSFSMVAESPL